MDSRWCPDFHIPSEGIKVERDRIAHIYETQFDSKLNFPVDKTSPNTPFHPKSLPPASSIPELHVLLDCSTHSKQNPTRPADSRQNRPQRPVALPHTKCLVTTVQRLWAPTSKVKELSIAGGK
jgi:hypothetical protein